MEYEVGLVPINSNFSFGVLEVCHIHVWLHVRRSSKSSRLTLRSVSLIATQTVICVMIKIPFLVLIFYKRSQYMFSFSL